MDDERLTVHMPRMVEVRGDGTTREKPATLGSATHTDSSDTALKAIEDLAVNVLQGGDRQRFAKAKRICDLAHSLMRTLSPQVEDFDADEIEEGNAAQYVMAQGRARHAGGNLGVADNANILRELSTAAMAALKSKNGLEDVSDARTRRSMLVSRVAIMESQMNGITDPEAKTLATRAFEEAKRELREVMDRPTTVETTEPEAAQTVPLLDTPIRLDP